MVTARERDADEFYAALAPDATPPEQMPILRQSCAGLVWSKQMYPYNVRSLAGRRPGCAASARRRTGTDATAAGDTSTRSTCSRCPTRGSTRGSPPGISVSTAVPWAHLDPAFAKYQLIVLLREWFQHPNGALPAYEWNFDDVNPPVHVMAALRVFQIDGGTDREFLERVFQKLLINFTWWLNREDADGNNVFSGGFLGLDNISPVDRSNLPEGVTLEQADGTAWMAYYALSMLMIALALAEENDVYWDMVIKFLEQFVLVARALEQPGPVRRRRRVLLRPPRVPVRRVDPGEGEDDLRPAPAAARGAAVEPGRPGRRAAREAFFPAAHGLGRERWIARGSPRPTDRSRPGGAAAR